MSSNFVGVRTADALIRFHGRAPLDLPVAVSHHAYVEPFDAPAMTQAWEGWLAGAFATTARTLPDQPSAVVGRMAYLAMP